MTRAEVISRFRNSIKEVSGDTKYTNRYLWSIFWSNAKLLLKRESEKPSIYNQTDIWQTICVKMQKVSPLLCDCLKLPVDCVVYRSRYKIPKMAEGNGVIYRFISSADLSNKLIMVTPFTYDLKKSKYNKEHYVFLHNGYLWAPNTKWSNLIISAIFEEEITSEFKCECEDTSQDSCGVLLSIGVGVPDYLVAPSIQMGLQELGLSKGIPQDENPNTNTNEKTIST